MTQNSVLVCGGAGYIGSHACWQLAQAGYKLVVIDDMSAGHAELLPPGVEVLKFQVGTYERVLDVLRSNQVHSVLHFAAKVQVEESVRSPELYLANNTAQSIELMRACVDAGVKNFIFSSTAAVYGDATTVPIGEDAPVQPINPYGLSKALAEQALRSVGSAHPMRYLIFRYFNVAGGRADGKTGQISEKATHLIKVAAECATKKRQSMTIFGSDYPTSDGTGVRDYIYVDDLVEAHLLGLKYLQAKGQSQTLNLGYGHGYSVKQVVDTMKRVSAVDFSVEMGSRRAGDGAELVADSTKARQILGWVPKHDSLEFICQTAFRWEQGLSLAQR